MICAVKRPTGGQAAVAATVLLGAWFRLPPILTHGPVNYDDGVFGHMTAKGNEHAANLIHPAVRDWLPTILGWSSQTHATPPPTPEASGALQP